MVNIACNTNSIWLKSPKILYHVIGGRPHSSWAISLAGVKRRFFERDVAGVEKRRYWCNHNEKYWHGLCQVLLLQTQYWKRLYVWMTLLLRH